MCQCVREQESTNTRGCLRFPACVCVCHVHAHVFVRVCDHCMTQSVTTVRRNNWTSWAETTAVKAVFSCDIQANALTKSHLTRPSYRKWKRKPLVHPVLHPKSLLCASREATQRDNHQYKPLLLQNNGHRTGWGWKCLAIGVKCLVSWHLSTED